MVSLIFRTPPSQSPTRAISSHLLFYCLFLQTSTVCILLRVVRINIDIAERYSPSKLKQGWTDRNYPLMTYNGNLFSGHNILAHLVLKLVLRSPSMNMTKICQYNWRRSQQNVCNRVQDGTRWMGVRTHLQTRECMYFWKHTMTINWIVWSAFVNWLIPRHGTGTVSALPAGGRSSVTCRFSNVSRLIGNGKSLGQQS